MRKHYTSVSVDVDVALEEILADFSREDVLEALGGFEPPRAAYDLSDSVVLLGVVTELRNRGYSVEPTT